MARKDDARGAETCRQFRTPFVLESVYGVAQSAFEKSHRPQPINVPVWAGRNLGMMFQAAVQTTRAVRASQVEIIAARKIKRAQAANLQMGWLAQEKM